jgi:cobalt-precorrin-6B (C15)-methyltransferase
MNDKYTSGMPDEMFERGDVPITKSEVRAIVLSKLMLAGGSRIIDIGAGTGSVTVEAALIADKGIVYSVERDPVALELIRRNIKKFGLGNVKVIKGSAPAALENTENFDRAFIGGSGGNIIPVLELVDRKIDDAGVIVVTAITLDTLFETRNFFMNSGYKYEIVQAAITRVQDTGSVSMLRALNPVYIISAVKGGS